ncbi:muramidase family protein [Paenibacillus spongiae]|uniref:LysM peptidoglycan-binding domain-containing protein n=1 Tax=Paenibacillus spongiae TaxID=2909671 RepID=A0ABY5SLG5_9BACL|nr:LysM peptidoglycan-binding domain-containing protein [Paenibacillus spongiae]UVI33360.1 LysM peptidoglycan-binding domain-containing protein [Paenibacillus spongiae]
MNKDSTGSVTPTRASRKRKNKTAYKIILASATFLLIICGVVYSIYETQSRSGQKQSAEENIPTGEETVENDESLNGDPTGDEQAGSSEASEKTPMPDELTYENEEPEEISPEAVPVKEADQDRGQERTIVPNKGSDGNKASASVTSGQTTKLPTTYKVQKGDTLSTISMKFYNSKKYVALLAEHNQIVFINDMNVGDTIKIPALSSVAGSKPKKQQDDMGDAKITLPVTYMVRAGDTLYRIAMQFYHSGDYAELIAEHNKLGEKEELKAGSHLIIPALPTNQAGSKNSTDKAGTRHTVRKGETLSSISRKYFGDSSYAKSIAKYNQLADNDDVKVGDVLKIPPVSTP